MTPPGWKTKYTPKSAPRSARHQTAGKPISEDGKHVDPFWHPKSQPVGYKSRLTELQDSLQEP
jgi:hypothetical protein